MGRTRGREFVYLYAAICNLYLKHSHATIHSLWTQMYLARSCFGSWCVSRCILGSDIFWISRLFLDSCSQPTSSPSRSCFSTRSPHPRACDVFRKRCCTLPRFSAAQSACLSACLPFVTNHERHHSNLLSVFWCCSKWWFCFGISTQNYSHRLEIQACYNVPRCS